MAPATDAPARHRRVGLGLFARDFDAPAGDGVIVLDEPEPGEGAAAEAPPAITREQLDEACAAAHAAGLASGRAEAEAAQAAERRALLDALLAQLRDADTEIRRAVDEAGAGLAGLLLASLAAGFPSLCARHGAAELARFTHEVTELLASQPRIVIRVHPAMLATLEDCLAALEPERRAAILVETRDTLAPGDARIAWHHGLAVRDAAAVQARLADILAPLGLAPANGPGAETPLPASPPPMAHRPAEAPALAAMTIPSPSQPTRFDVAAAS